MMIQIALTVLSISVPIVFGVMFFLFKRSLFTKIDETTTEVKETKKDVQDIGDSLSKFQIKVAETYASKKDIEPNNEAHRDLWKELNGLRERVAANEAVYRSIVHRPERAQAPEG